MAISKACWGIDVGQNALKAIRVRQSGGDVEAIGFDVIEHDKILSQPDADEQQLVRSALEKFLSRNDVRGDSIVVSVPGQASFSRFIKLPPVDLRKIPEIVRYEAGQQIPFNLEDVIWDYQTMTMPSGGPSEIEVGIFAMKRDIVQDYVNDFTQVRVTPDLVQMAPVALYNYLRYDRHDGAGATLLLDIGTENTSLVIADGFRVWVRNFPLGGNNFTQALVKNFKLNFSKAENLKRHAAESKYAREIFQAMRPVFSDMLTEIQRSIGFYTSLHRESRIERVLGMGNTFRLPGLQKFLSQHLGVDVTVVEQFNSLKGDRVVSAANFKENVVGFGVAYGLALQGLGLGTINTSLLPPEILKEKQLRKKRPVVIASAAAVVLACGLLGYSASKSANALAKPLDAPDIGSFEEGGEPVKVFREIKALNDAGKENAKKIEEAKLQLRQTQQQLQRYQNVFRNQHLWYKVLANIWQAVPKPNEFNPGSESAYVAARNQPPWQTIPAVEILSISGDVVEVAPAAAAAATSEAGNMADGGLPSMPSEKIRVLQVIIEGTMPRKPNEDPYTLLEERLLKSLRADRENSDVVFSQVSILNMIPEYRTVSGYPYPEREDPMVLLQQQQQKQSEDDKSRTSREKPVEAPRRPYRGNDTWFRVQFYVNLDNAQKTVAVAKPAENATDGDNMPGGGNGFGDPNYGDGY